MTTTLRLCGLLVLREGGLGMACLLPKLSSLLCLVKSVRRTYTNVYEHVSASHTPWLRFNMPVLAE